MAHAYYSRTTSKVLPTLLHRQVSCDLARYRKMRSALSWIVFGSVALSFYTAKCSDSKQLVAKFALIADASEPMTALNSTTGLALFRERNQCTSNPKK